MKLEHVTLRKTTISQLHFVNNIEGTSMNQLDLSVELDNNLEANNEDDSFVSKLHCKIYDKKGQETFNISIELIGIFNVEEQLDLTNTSVNSFAMMILFPYIQSYISTLTTVAGIPPLYLPNLPVTVKPIE